MLPDSALLCMVLRAERDMLRCFFILRHYFLRRCLIRRFATYYHMLAFVAAHCRFSRYYILRQYYALRHADVVIYAMLIAAYAIRCC